MIGIKFIMICFFTVESLCRNSFTVLDSDEQESSSQYDFVKGLESEKQLTESDLSIVEGNIMSSSEEATSWDERNIWPWALPQSYIKQHGKARHLQGYNALMRTEPQNDQTSQETIIISSGKETESEGQSNHYMRGYKSVRPESDGNDAFYYKMLYSYENEDNHQEQSPSEGRNEYIPTYFAESRRRSGFRKEHRRGTESDDNFVTDDKIMSSSVERKKPWEDSHKSNVYSEEIKTDPHTYCDAAIKWHMQKGDTKLKNSYRKKMTTPLYQQMQKDAILKDNTANSFENPEIPQSEPLSDKKMTKPLYQQMQKDAILKDNTANSFENPEIPQSEPLSDKKMTKPLYQQMQKDAILKDNTANSFENPEIPQSEPLSDKKMTKPLYQQMQKDAILKDNTANSFENTENPHAEPHSYNTLYRKKMTKPQDAKMSMENITNSNAISSLTKPKGNIKISSYHTENMEVKPESVEYKKSFEDGNQNESSSENINKSSGTTMIVPRNSSVEVGNQNQGIRAYESESHEAQRLEARDYLEYPYSVSIQRKGAHYASGALVGKRWVLTTAQEFYNVGETIRLFRMRLGSIDCKKGGILIPIKRVTVHPNFTPGQPAFDVSILMSPEPIPLSRTVQPIGISRIDDSGKIENMKFMKFTITYWPRIVLKQGVIPDSATERIMFNIMRVASQTLIPTAACIKHMAAADVKLDNNSMCLKPVKKFHSDCMADAGAPMISMDGLWGITSGWVSPLCPTVPQTVILTRVSSSTLHAWIDATTATA